jgi:hypothetical protein
MHRIFREPLFHFMAVAVLLLLLDTGWRHFRKPVVEISAAAVDARSRTWQETAGEPPSTEQRMQIAKELAIEEVFFREALKRDMAADNRVRTSLIQMMRTSLKPPVTPPSDDQLKEIRAESPRENIMLPAKVSFEHVSFSNSSEVPNDLPSRLRGGEKPPESTLSVRMANPLPPTFQPQLERLLGKEFTTAVFALPLEEWHGPMTSSRGVHFLRIHSREPEQPIPFEQIRGMLEAKWIQLRENEVIAVEGQKLEKQYRIVLPSSTTPTPAKP